MHQDSHVPEAGGLPEPEAVPQAHADSRSVGHVMADTNRLVAEVMAGRSRK